MLTARRQRFIQEYALCGNACEAARRAGYSPKTAHKKGYMLLRIPAIRDGIDKALQDLRKSSVADLQEVQEFLTDVLRGKVPGAKTRDRVAAANILQRRYPVEPAGDNNEVAIIDDICGGDMTIK